jgi:hypothetical protein
MGNYTKNLFKRNKLRPNTPAPVLEETFDESFDDVVITSALDDTVPIKLWIDDTREPPAGWVWVKSMREAIALFDQNENYAVSHMAVDYYMDHNSPGAPTGDVIVSELISRMNYFDRPQVFANTLRVNCHSSDRDMRIKTARVIKAAQEEGDLNKDCRVSIHPA